MSTIVNGLSKEYEGTASGLVLDATTEENQAKIRELGFESHGLVILDAQNQPKVKINGHNMTEPEIRKALEGVLAGA